MTFCNGNLQLDVPALGVNLLPVTGAPFLKGIQFTSKLRLLTYKTAMDIHGQFRWMDFPSFQDKYPERLLARHLVSAQLIFFSRCKTILQKSHEIIYLHQKRMTDTFFLCILTIPFFFFFGLLTHWSSELCLIYVGYFSRLFLLHTPSAV